LDTNREFWAISNKNEPRANTLAYSGVKQLGVKQGTNTLAYSSGKQGTNTLAYSNGKQGTNTLAYSCGKQGTNTLT
jgi:hypothetical protein